MSCENLSNISIKLRTANMWCEQTRGWNGISSTAERVNFIVQSWYFSALCFHAFYSIRTNFRKSFRLSHKTWSHSLFSQHLEAYILLVLWWTCLQCDIFFLSWKLKNWSLKSIAITFCKKRRSCDRVIKRGLGDLSSQAHGQGKQLLFTVF